MASPNSANRYSMPVSRTRNGAYDGDFDGSNVTRFLFGEDIVNGMGHANAVDDRFPTLVRRDDQMVSEICYCFSCLLYPQECTWALFGEALRPVARAPPRQHLASWRRSPCSDGVFTFYPAVAFLHRKLP